MRDTRTPYQFDYIIVGAGVDFFFFFKKKKKKISSAFCLIEAGGR